MSFLEKLSEKVTPTRLDTMYSNFVKITDWVVKGKASKYPMPAALQRLFDKVDEVDTNAEQVKNLTSLVTKLQQAGIDKDADVEHLKNTLANVNQQLSIVVTKLENQSDVAPTPAPKKKATPKAETPAPTPVAPQVTPAIEVEADDELIDLDAPVTPVAVSPKEEAIQVSAAAVGAGNIDPASYEALDAEIENLMQ